ncbi:Protein of unknown function [Gryllus bimaculatus]|nr:Protein of unknown function [Gryllus bimaculatus]
MQQLNPALVDAHESQLVGLCVGVWAGRPHLPRPKRTTSQGCGRAPPSSTSSSSAGSVRLARERLASERAQAARRRAPPATDSVTATRSVNTATVNATSPSASTSSVPPLSHLHSDASPPPPPHTLRRFKRSAADHRTFERGQKVPACDTTLAQRHGLTKKSASGKRASSEASSALRLSMAFSLSATLHRSATSASAGAGTALKQLRSSCRSCRRGSSRKAASGSARSPHPDRSRYSITSERNSGCPSASCRPTLSAHAGGGHAPPESFSDNLPQSDGKARPGQPQGPLTT